VFAVREPAGPQRGIEKAGEALTGEIKRMSKHVRQLVPRSAPSRRTTTRPCVV